MAHRALILLAALASCGPGKPAEDAQAKAKAARPSAWNAPGESWGKFHSKRFNVTIPLPDGKAWKIDDHRGPALVATHPATGSVLVVEATQEEELVNRQRCEERARKRGWVPSERLTTVEDHVLTGPDAYDSRLWVALDPDHADTRVDGHVYLFGAFLRRCLLVHLTTSIATAKDEDILATRLAIASDRIVKAITPDAPRVGEDAVVPRAPAEIRR